MFVKGAWIDVDPTDEEILAFAEEKGIIYTSDVADRFNLDLRKAVDLVNALIESGRLIETRKI